MRASEMIWSCRLSKMLIVKIYGVGIKNFSVNCGLAKRSSSRNWSWLERMML